MLHFRLLAHSVDRFCHDHRLYNTLIVMLFIYLLAAGTLLLVRSKN